MENSKKVGYVGEKLEKSLKSWNSWQKLKISEKSWKKFKIVEKFTRYWRGAIKLFILMRYVKNGAIGQDA